MVCPICGKEFDEKQVNAIEYIKYKDTERVHLVKRFKFNGVIIEPCQNCLLPFAKGLIAGRNSTGTVYDDGFFKNISNEESK